MNQTRNSVNESPAIPLEQIETIKEFLADTPMELFLFMLLVDGRMPIKGLLKLRVQDVKDAKPGERLKRVGKEGILAVDKEIYETLQAHLREEQLQDNDYFFTKVLIEMKVTSLLVDQESKTCVMILKDPQEQSALPIWIGLLEANAIALGLKQLETFRPMTHDLIKTLLNNLNVDVAPLPGRRVERSLSKVPFSGPYHIGVHVQN